MDNNLQKKVNTGLTQEEVNEKISRGLVNGDIDIRTKSYKKIVFDNLFTLFNGINIILLICILISGSYKNALFFLVVIWNFIIGTFQEIRAKRIVEKLSLLTAPKVYALRDGQIVQLNASEIVLGEIMRLHSGNQICADSVVLSGSCQVNESLLTGESTPVLKKQGDHLLSGSFLVSGQIYAETEHIGIDNYVNQITLGAKYYKKTDSVIMSSVKNLVRIIAVMIIPLTALLVWNNFFREDLTFSSAMVKTVAGISSMIPGGLVLLVSVVLAVSVVRLSYHKTLVQDLYCVENLARVDMLLLDKTGTITDGNLKIEKIEAFHGFHEQVSNPFFKGKDPETLLRVFESYSTDNNGTANAVIDYLNNGASTAAGSKENHSVSDKKSDEYSLRDPEQKNVLNIPFSSERKWSLVYLQGKGSLIMGAPEYILKDETYREIRELSLIEQEKGNRAVLFALSDHSPVLLNKTADREGTDIVSDLSSFATIDTETDFDKMTLPQDCVPAALLILGEKIRDNAAATFAYFESQGVQLKVISGDSPVTVSRVALNAGLKEAAKWADASGLSDEELKNKAEDYTIFGRVTPAQKLEIVKALKEKGHVVAMTGDGANDVLALKEADCSIAMQSGADAARNVASMVLLNSDFASLPLVVDEGRKSINNLQRSASLYLIKTIYSFIFAVFFVIVTQLIYPFENIQVTLIGAVSIGVPSFFLALEPNHRRIREHFLKNVLRMAVPTGIMEAAALMALTYILEFRIGAFHADISTASTYMMLILGIITVFNISGKINLWKCGLLLFIAAIAAGAVLLFPGLFSITAITFAVWKPVLIIALIYLIIHTILIRLFLRDREEK